MPPPIRPQQAPSHVDTMAQLLSASAASVPVSEPATVLSYNAATQRAVVKPSLKLFYTTAEDETGLAHQDQAAVADVPVAWPASSSGALVGTLSPGDQVLLVVAGRSLDEWKVTGNANITQQSKRRHSMQDAVAFPMAAVPLLVSQWASGALVLSGTDVRLGSSLATSPVALATPNDANNAALFALLTAMSLATTWTAAQGLLVAFVASGVYPQPTAATTTKAL